MLAVTPFNRIMSSATQTKNISGMMWETGQRIHSLLNSPGLNLTKHLLEKSKSNQPTPETQCTQACGTEMFCSLPLGKKNTSWMYVYMKPTGPLLDCVAVLVWLKSANLKKRPVLLNAHTVCALQRKITWVRMCGSMSENQALSEQYVPIDWTSWLSPHWM